MFGIKILGDIERYQDRKISVSNETCEHYPVYKDKFKFCPDCGKELTETKIVTKSILEYLPGFYHEDDYGYIGDLKFRHNSKTYDVKYGSCNTYIINLNLENNNLESIKETIEELESIIDELEKLELEYEYGLVEA